MVATEYETDILAELVTRKYENLLQLREMGRRQHELIDGGQMARLLELLAAKQRVLLALQEIERALEPFRGQDPEKRRWRTAEARQQCAARLEQCEALLAEIISREKLCEQALRRRRDQAAQQLQGTHAAGQARGAYLAEDAQQFHQLDLSSES